MPIRINLDVLSGCDSFQRSLAKKPLTCNQCSAARARNHKWIGTSAQSEAASTSDAAHMLWARFIMRQSPRTLRMGCDTDQAVAERASTRLAVDERGNGAIVVAAREPDGTATPAPHQSSSGMDAAGCWPRSRSFLPTEERFSHEASGRGIAR